MNIMISSGIQTEEVTTETFTCPICFENIKPFNCVKLPNCSHRYFPSEVGYGF